jgi:bifunctional non-homologous end joining protein LigD
MRLLRIPQPVDHPSLIYELKYDGFRGLAYIDGHFAKLVSRNGHTFTQWPYLCTELAHAVRCRNAVLDGEIVCLGADGRSRFNSLLFRREWPHLMAFDLLWLDGEDLRRLPLFERKRRLKAIMPTVESHVRYASHVERRGTALFDAACRRDLEGIVAKWRDGTYRNSERGAPPWSREAKYLLTGLLSCRCGAGMEARSRPSVRAERVRFYECSAHHSQGRTICSNGLILPMDVADDAVLSAVKDSILHPKALDLALSRLTARLTKPVAADPASLLRQLRRVDQELERLASAIAAGGEMAALVAKMKECEQRRHQIADALRPERKPLQMDPSVISIKAKELLADWKGTLQGDVPRARQLLKQLIVGRLKLTPQKDRSYLFEGAGTLRPVIEGVFPGSVASPPGFEPGFQP